MQVFPAALEVDAVYGQLDDFLRQLNIESLQCLTQFGRNTAGTLWAAAITEVAILNLQSAFKNEYIQFEPTVLCLLKQMQRGEGAGGATADNSNDRPFLKHIVSFNTH